MPLYSRYSSPHSSLHGPGSQIQQTNVCCINRTSLIAVVFSVVSFVFCSTPARAALVIDLDLDLATPFFAATPETALSAAIPSICTAVSTINNPTRSQTELAITCDAIQNSTNQAEQDTALEAISSRASTAVTNSTNRMNIAPDVSGIGSRLSALRHGITSSLAGLTLKLDGQPLPFLMLRRPPRSTLRGGGGGEQPAASFVSRLGWFASGNFTSAKQARTNTEMGFDSDVQGIGGGVDYRFMDQLFAGVALNLAQSDADLNNNVGSLDGDSFNITLYGTYYVKDQWHIEGTFHVGQGKYDLERRIQFTVGSTTVSGIASSSTDANQFGFSVGGGYAFQLPKVLQGTALAGLSYSRANIDGFTESGAGGLSLSVSGQSIDRLTLNFGGQITRPISVNWGVVSPLVSLFLLYEVENDGERIRAGFVNDPAGTRFSFDIQDRDNFYVDFAVGASVTFARGISGFAQIKTLQLLDNFDETSLNFGFRMEL